MKIYIKATQNSVATWEDQVKLIFNTTEGELFEDHNMDRTPTSPIFVYSETKEVREYFTVRSKFLKRVKALFENIEFGKELKPEMDIKRFKKKN